MGRVALVYTSLRVENLKAHVNEYISKSGVQDPAHLRDHVMRVYELGMWIGIEEKANLETLAAALLLHDIIRPADKGGESNHALRSAEYAKNLLPRFDFTEDEISTVMDAIITSSRSGGNYEIPNTLEAKIVYDADKADGGGELGIKRAQEHCKRQFELEGEPYDEKKVAEWYLSRVVDVLKVGIFTRKAKELMKEPLEISLKYCESVLGTEYVNQKVGDLKTKLNIESK